MFCGAWEMGDTRMDSDSFTWERACSTDGESDLKYLWIVFNNSDNCPVAKKFDNCAGGIFCCFDIYLLKCKNCVYTIVYIIWHFKCLRIC